MTRTDAIAAAATVLTDSRAHRDELPVEAAAREAHVPGGPTLEQLTDLIRTQRAQARATQGAAA